MRTVMQLLTIGVLALALSGCGQSSTKATILDKARNAATKQELEKALGKPTEVSAIGVGPLESETWKYKAADGTVEFVIVNGKVLVKKAQ